MAFKLIVFIGILIAVAVLGMRAYRASVRGFEARRMPSGRGDGDSPLLPPRGDSHVRSRL